MNTHLQHQEKYNEAFGILAEIVDDTMSLALEAECLAPSYVEGCVRMVLQFHPNASRITVDGYDLRYEHDEVVVNYQIIPEDYIEDEHDTVNFRCECGDEIAIAGNKFSLLLLFVEQFGYVLNGLDDLYTGDRGWELDYESAEALIKTALRLAAVDSAIFPEAIDFATWLEDNGAVTLTLK